VQVAVEVRRKPFRDREIAVIDFAAAAGAVQGVLPCSDGERQVLLVAASIAEGIPPFVLGVEEAEAFGDFGTRSGRLPVDSALAWSIRDGFARDGFDIALSYALTVDHGIVQSYDMVAGQADLPLVPLVVNTAGPPLPSMPRCVALGHSLGAAIRASNAGRVLVIASGGLSHWLPSNDPRDSSVPADRRAAMIHGGHEIRTWLTGFAAAGRPLVWTSYEPVPEWITGMGIGTTFEVA
jgi:2,3-dihydroxyphenylpropionate 1,2-dioxygenase